MRFFAQGSVRRVDVRVIAAAGGVERKLAEIRPGLSFGGLASLAWCPDATCVLVTDSLGPGKADALFAVSFDGSKRRQVTHPDGLVADVDPAVSPDGRSLIFRRNAAPHNGAFYRVALNGRAVPQGEPLRLTGPLSMGTSAWTLDSREIVFSARRALWRLDALRGGTPERLAFVGQDGQSPVIARTADGKQRLVYVRTVSDSNVWRLTTSAPGVPASTAPVRPSRPRETTSLPGSRLTAVELPSGRTGPESRRSGLRTSMVRTSAR